MTERNHIQEAQLHPLTTEEKMFMDKLILQIHVLLLGIWRQHDFG
jgi:hypothetical protein